MSRAGECSWSLVTGHWSLVTGHWSLVTTGSTHRWGNLGRAAHRVSTGSTTGRGNSGGRRTGFRQAQPPVGEPREGGAPGFDRLNHRTGKLRRAAHRVSTGSTTGGGTSGGRRTGFRQAQPPSAGNLSTSRLDDPGQGATSRAGYALGAGFEKR
ncbi:hypothetical protein E3T28_01850 [Cryobacterium sinapicolor]|uniref:Uncharacterized protein n=1 Tax=Cryobacterium sinapicolor TaxID=1259236 RepID=A0ABY2JFH3_9MICO|nr:hypothetical protein E3T28_01850 [Cryobacterium sinapicolor]